VWEKSLVAAATVEGCFFVAERRLSLGRRFNAGAEYGRNTQSRSDDWRMRRKDGWM